MANTFLKAEVIAPVALELLRRQLVLPRLVRRLGIADFKGAKNDTINVRVPAILSARDYTFRTRTAPTVVDELEELSIPVTLDKHPYSAIGVTDEEMTLDIISFTEQVLQPQVIAVAEKLESYIAAVMVGADLTATAVTYTETTDGANAPFYRAVIDARKALNDLKVPTTDRIIVLGSGVEAAALKEPAFRKVDESGSTDALRNAIIGNVGGFTIIGNMQGLPEDFAMAFHASAFVFGNVAPIVPAGVTFGQGVTEQGLRMRWIRDYDPNYLRDRSVVSSFAGAASVEDARNASGDLTGKNQRAVMIDATLL